MAITNNIYPPIVETYLPAFLADSDDIEKNICKVYFSISQFNSLSEIANVQITIRNQNTNLSVLDEIKYPSGIKLANIYIDPLIQTDYKYYVKIEKEDVKNEQFEINEYYKIQLRFTSVEAASHSLDIPQALDSWISENLDYFSEWSTVSLVRAISTPTITIKDFPQDETTIVNWAIGNTKLIGAVSFQDSNETDVLKSYQIKLYDNANNLLTDSGILYTDNYNDMNSFIYTLKYSFSADQYYYFTVDYTTQSLYKDIQTFNFRVEQQSALVLDFILTGEKDIENGRNLIRVQRNGAQSGFTGTVIIRRSSSKTNFTIWEDLYSKSFINTVHIDFSWYDSTIESGVFYNYAIQGIDSEGKRGVMTKFVEPTMMIFDHMFLTSKDKQLKIEFNPSVSSFKKIYAESKNDTIGSKYPFIRRNGYTEYAQIPISGLICSDMDEDNVFTSEEEIYGTNFNFYEQYNWDNAIYHTNDIVWEKMFRDKVIDFLYSDDVKIFRSATEGNFLVRIMDISLTPNQTLGRRLWSFSGTAYQIDDFTIDQCKKYGILEE